MAKQVCVGLFPEDADSKEVMKLLENAGGMVNRCKLKRTHPPDHDCLCFTNATVEKPECLLRTVDYKVHAYVHFATEQAAAKVCKLSDRGRLFYKGSVVRASAVENLAKKSELFLKNVTLEVGSLLSWNEFMISWREKATFELNVDERKLSFLFNHDVAYCNKRRDGENRWSRCEVKLDFRLRDVKNIFEVEAVDKDELGTWILLHFWNTPLIYYRTVDEIQEEFCPDEDDGDPWVRTVDFTIDKSIGRCLGYRILIPLSQNSALRKILNAFDCHRMLEKRVLTLTRSPYELKRSFQRQEIYSVSGKQSVPFELLFLVNALIHKGLVCVENLNDRFFELLQPGSNDTQITSLALRHMLTYNHQIFEVSRRLNQVIGWILRGARIKRLWTSDDTMLVYRLVITPTKAYCIAPEPEMSNRVLRHYREWSDSFLRVSFLDDDLDGLRYGTLEGRICPYLRKYFDKTLRYKTAIYRRVLTILSDGFELCGRRYSFLAFSANQLRDQSAWFFARNSALRVEDIREWMGDFPQMNVAKCASRMGQCFSQTRRTVEVSSKEVETIPDIERNGYNFSDGIGKIAPELTSQIAECLEISDDVPSAFQIRYAGCKGVVASWPMNGGIKLALRPSMDKFFSKHRILEVVKWSDFVPAFLNRQIIILLSTLAVADNVFVRLQEKMIRRLNMMFSDPNLALELLITTCAHGGPIDAAVMMLRAGFKPDIEPHLRNLLLAFRAVQFEQLITKARIFVSDGRLLLGCLDESGKLEYGQCFIRISNPWCATDKSVITGTLFMAKNPCLHPGDIRILEAVDIPCLHHMVDCLVLPQNGLRPHQDEASGSDLDGDQYFVSWDSELLPPSHVSWHPMEPPLHAKPQNIGRTVNTRDIVKFFIRHMMNANLGRICNAHLVQADLSELGALDDTCLRLAELAFMAVDYPKTGISVEFTPDLYPKKYPDFMEKEKYVESYESKGILGILYRQVKIVAEVKMAEADDIDEKRREGIFYDSSLQVEGYGNHLDSAWGLKCLYDEKLRALMGQFNIKSEGEVVSGFVRMRHTKKNSNFQGELKERIDRGYASLRKEFRVIFETSNSYEQANEDELSECKKLTNILRHQPTVIPVELVERLKLWEEKASAWYHVSYDERWLEKSNEILDSEIRHRQPLFSFAWIAFDVLSNLKRPTHS